MDGTILSQGVFTQPATAITQYVAVPSGIDWFMTYNKTQIDAGTASAGVSFYWQRGMPAGYAIESQNNAGSTATFLTSVTTGGFTLYDPSGQTPGALPLLGAAIPITTGIGNTTRPVITVNNTAGVSAGSVVRVSSSAQTDINGIDFVVGAVVPNTTITLLAASNALATAPGAISGAVGFYRLVNYSPLFYPRARTITNITQAVNAQVSTSIAHGLTPGQEVRFNIPAVSGMTGLNPNQLNNYYPSNSSQAAIIQTVVDDYNFTINIDTTSYAPFTYPTIAQQPSSFPEVTPFGEDTATALLSNTAQVPTIGGVQIFNTNTGILADSTVNTGFIGMILPTGVNSPGGIAGDQVYWRAGKASFGGL